LPDLHNRREFYMETIGGPQKEGINYGEGDGIINNFAWLSHNGSSLRNLDQVHRESFIAMHAFAVTVG